MRINKYIAGCGVCSRRGADGLISEGRVTIDGRIAGHGDDVTEMNVVCVDGRPVHIHKDHVIMAYYKPVGVTCTEKDPHADRIVTDEIRSDRRLTYAGRLDKDSEGLLIMTDDGDLIDAMMRGANMHEKEYEVTVSGIVTDEHLRKMSEGIYIEELDTVTRPCKISRMSARSFNIILTQGLNRQIRRMCSAVGLHVTSLKRTRVMNVRLGKMQVGASRLLTSEEEKELYFEVGLHR